MKKLLMIGASGLVMLSVPAIAGNHDKDGSYNKTEKAKEMFEAADKDGNGLISKDEYMEHVKAKAAEKFEAKDVDADGNISMDESKAYMKKKHADMKEKREEMREKIKAKMDDKKAVLSESETAVKSEAQDNVE